MLAPQFSIVIPWCNREELQFTLRENAHWFQHHDLEVLTVNCGGDANQLRQLVLNSGATRIRQISIPSASFNKCLALNIGILCSRAPWIFVLDGDIILKSDILKQSAPCLASGAYVTVRRVCESSLGDASENVTLWNGPLPTNSFIASIEKTTTLELHFHDGASVGLPTYRYNLLDGSRLGCGLLLASRHDLIAVGGYNSNIELWGWEDNDIQFRLKKVREIHQVELGEVLHLSHGDEKRSLNGESRSNANEMNFHYVCGRYALGDFAGTYSRDIEEWENRITQVIYSS